MAICKPRQYSRIHLLSDCCPTDPSSALCAVHDCDSFRFLDSSSVFLPIECCTLPSTSILSSNGVAVLGTSSVLAGVTHSSKDLPLKIELSSLLLAVLTTLLMH